MLSFLTSWPGVFGVVEFQLVDKVTAQKNEAGDNRHALYKARQRQRVKRLEAGRKGAEQQPSQLSFVAEDGSDITAPLSIAFVLEQEINYATRWWRRHTGGVALGFQKQ